MSRNKGFDALIADAEKANKWNSCKGQLSNPEIRAKALAVRKANDFAAYRDPANYIRKLFNTPKKGGSTTKKMCLAVERISKEIAERIMDGRINDLEDLIKVQNQMGKMIDFIKKLSDPVKPVVPGTQVNVVVNTSKTGGVVGSILDVESEVKTDEREKVGAITSDL